MSAVKKRRKERIRRIFRGDADLAWREWKRPPSRKQRFNKWAVCVMLYAATVVLFRLEHPWTDKAEHYVRTALTESFDFRKAEQWYRTHIGSLPSFLPAFGSKERGEFGYVAPVAGKLGTYTTSGEGIRLITEPDVGVRAVGEGWVIFAGTRPDTGLTVVLRHADGLESVYGQLGTASVGRGDWVKGGAMIGTVRTGRDRKSGTLYFAVKRHDEYVDPGDVIPLD